MGCLASRLAVGERAEATMTGDEENALLQDIRNRREALSACPQGHPDRAMRAQKLGYSLHARYKQCGDLDLLDESIELEREALALQPPGHPSRTLSCGNLAASLHARYKQCGDIGLLDEVIELEREALALRPPGHPNRALSCGNLAASLRARYEQCGDIGLLDESIELKREALALRPPGHPSRAVSCANLAVSLHARHKQCGDIGLLNEAIELERQALALLPPGHPDHAHSCGNLAASLRLRYEQCSDVGLLDEAIELQRKALALHPPRHSNHAASCTNLAVSLHARYEQCSGLGLLDEAIELEREALALLPPGHPDHAQNCGNLAASLRVRYKQCGDVGLLDEAIELNRQALALQPRGHPNWSLLRRHLSLSLRDCYRHTNNPALLDEAIDICSHSLQHGTSLEAWRSFSILSELHLIPNTSHFSLASGLRYLDLSLASDFDNIYEFIDNTTVDLSHVWGASSVWASDTPLRLCSMYTQLIDRLPLAAGFVLDTSSRLQTLKSTHHIGTDACVAAILAEQPSQAIELLDRAHGMVWTQALHQRDPQTEGAPPELAAELADHLRAIAAPVPAQVGDSSQLAHHQDARHKRNTRIQAILREIRAMNGLERFMLGASYDTLRMAAHEHPVAVLVAGRGHAFALIISNATQDQPHTLRLDLTSDDLSALRVSAERAGLRSRADMRDCEPEARLGLASRRTETGINHKPHQVLAEIWHKVIQPVIEYLQLEVCVRTRRSVTRLTHDTESHRSVTSSHTLVCKRRLRLPPIARCGHILGTPSQSNVLLGLHCLLVYSNCLSTAAFSSSGTISQVHRREHAPRRRRQCEGSGLEQTMERPHRARVC
jgi:tetratricopeptide (TPR) repeat protein